MGGRQDPRTGGRPAHVGVLQCDLLEARRACGRPGPRTGGLQFKNCWRAGPRTGGLHPKSSGRPPKPAYAGVRQRDVPQARARGRHDSRTGMLMCGSVMSFRRERVGVRTQGLVCGRHTLACGSVTSLCDWAQEPADDLHMLTCGSVTSLWQELVGDRTQADVAKQQNRTLLGQRPHCRRRHGTAVR